MAKKASVAKSNKAKDNTANHAVGESTVPVTSQSEKPKEGGQVHRIPGLPYRLINQYVADFSFEYPGAHAVILKGQHTNSDCQVRWVVEVGRFPENKLVFDVNLKVVLDCKDDGTQIFLLELDQHGLVVVAEQVENLIPQITQIEIPRMLFPFARRTIIDMMTDNGFNSVNLEPFDFASVFLANQQRAQQAASDQQAKSDQQS